ncbi:MAG: hypothetical protein ACWA5W_03315 [Phycisphaerales bacterium]
MIEQHLIPLLLLSPYSYGQDYQHPPPTSFQMNCWQTHISQLPDLNVAPCVHQGTAYRVWEFEEVEVDSFSHETTITLTGLCQTWECGDPPPTNLNARCGFTEIDEFCWGASGNVSAELKRALLARIGAEAEIGGQFNDCHSRVPDGAISGDILEPCTERDCKTAREIITERVMATEYQEVANWECTFSNGVVLEVGTKCNPLTGVAHSESTKVDRIWFSLPRAISTAVCPECGPDC